MRLVVLGTSNHARSCLDVISSAGMEAMGCVGPPPDGPLQVPYLGGDELLAELGKRPSVAAIIAVGENRLRQRLSTAVLSSGLALATVVASTAYVAPTAALGAGTIVMHQAAVGAYARIGDHVVVNTSTSIDHDCVIGDFAHLAPGTHLAGNVTVDDGAFLGTGVSVAPGSHIGAWAMVGAGATVITDIRSNVTAVGTPARAIQRP